LLLRIHLPLGSPAGEYEVRLHRKADKKEVLRAHRNVAKANGFIFSPSKRTLPNSHPVPISSPFSRLDGKKKFRLTR